METQENPPPATQNSSSCSICEWVQAPGAASSPAGLGSPAPAPRAGAMARREAAAEASCRVVLLQRGKGRGLPSGAATLPGGQARVLPVSHCRPAKRHSTSQARHGARAIAATRPTTDGSRGSQSPSLRRLPRLRCLPRLILVPAASAGAGPSACVCGCSPGKGSHFNFLTPKDIFRHVLETWKTLS